MSDIYQDALVNIVPSGTLKECQATGGSNAKTIEDAGAGIIIEEKDLTKDVLEDKIESIINDDKKLMEMSLNAKKVGDNKAIERIENEIDKLVVKK